MQQTVVGNFDLLSEVLLLCWIITKAVKSDLSVQLKKQTIHYRKMSDLE